MSAAPATPEAFPAHWRGYDLRTVEGSEAWSADYARRRAIAEDFHRDSFEAIAEHVRRVKELINSVLTDLASHSELSDTIVEVAKIARENYCIGLMVPDRGDEADAPIPFDVAASDECCNAGPHRDDDPVALARSMQQRRHGGAS